MEIAHMILLVENIESLRKKKNFLRGKLSFPSDLHRLYYLPRVQNSSSKSLLQLILGGENGIMENPRTLIKRGALFPLLMDS